MGRRVDPVLRCTRTFGHVSLVFEWSGGEYVEIAEAGYGPHDVINVFDYAEGKATVPFEQKALAAKVDEWLSDQDPRQFATEMIDYRMCR